MNAARFLLGLTLLLPTPACSQAQSAPQPFGDGALACSVYADAFSESNAGRPELAAARGRYAQWVVGYLSGYNAQNSQRFRAAFGVFGDAQRAREDFALWWVYDVCKVNPQATIHQAVQEFIAWRLREERQPAQAPAAPESPCVRAKIAAFHRAKERYADGTEKPVTSEMLDEWRAQCSQAGAGAIHSPASGSPERKAILDAYRPLVVADLGAPVEFAVRTVRVSGNNAFVAVDAQRPGGGRIAKERTPYGQRHADSLDFWDCCHAEAVLQRSGASWQVLEHKIGATDVWYESWYDRLPRDLFTIEAAQPVQAAAPASSSVGACVAAKMTIFAATNGENAPIPDATLRAWDAQCARKLGK